jgi:flagellar biosynthetic protein FlhB
VAKEGETGEKTEDATAQKQEEAREKGQVPLSTELISSIALMGSLGLFLGMSGPVLEILGHGVRTCFAQLTTIGPGEIDIMTATRLMDEHGNNVMDAVVMFALPLLMLTLLLGYGQVGFRISPKAIELDITKLNPIKGLGRLFSMRSVMKTGLATLKVIFIGFAISFTIYTQLDLISGIDGSELGPLLLIGRGVFIRVVIAALIAIFVLGVVDFLYQRYQHSEDLRMSKQEVKQEGKNSEGDPQIKARIRQVQREMAGRRMMDDVPDATVVVTNPTHYAVALKYERSAEGGSAPRVVAKGMDQVAQRIKQIARENDVICFEDVPLARALHAQCEIGEYIPEDLFEAVAAVLAYVYRVRGEHVGA